MDGVRPLYPSVLVDHSEVGYRVRCEWVVNAVVALLQVDYGLQDGAGHCKLRWGKASWRAYI